MKNFVCVLLSIVIFITPILAQDTYPYFSDPEKQLLYGNKKIEIVFKESTKQIISGGGSQFNPLYLLKDDSFLFEDMPMLYNSSVSTSYIYESEFKIFQNNRELSEIDFLEIIGLSDKANSIKAKYKNRMERYYSNPTYEARVEDDSMEGIGVLALLCGGITAVISGLAFIFDSNCDICEPGYQEDRGRMFLWGAGITTFGWYLLMNPKTKKVIKNRERPVLKQQLSNTQITDLAESYNRRIFQEIKGTTP